MKLRNVLWVLSASTLISGCKSGPRVSVCVIDAAAQVLRCADPDQKPFDIELKDSDNYGCLSPDDFEKVIKALSKQPAVKTVLEPVKTQLQASKKTKEWSETVFGGDGPRPF